MKNKEQGKEKKEKDDGCSKGSKKEDDCWKTMRELRALLLVERKRQEKTRKEKRLSGGCPSSTKGEVNQTKREPGWPRSPRMMSPRDRESQERSVDPTSCPMGIEKADSGFE